MKKLFQTLSGVFAVVPGLAILMTGLTILPGRKLLFAGCTEAICCLSILILYANKTRIARSTQKQINSYVGWLIAFFFIFLTIYFFLFKLCVVVDQNAISRNPKASPEDYTVVFPIIQRRDVKILVSKFADKSEAVNLIGATLMNTAIEKDSFLYAITIILFLLLYLLVTDSLTIAFTILGIYTKTTMDSPPGAVSSDTTV